MAKGHSPSPRTGLDAFLKAYSAPVYDALSHIYSFGMTEHERFLVLATPRHAYVQCMLHDNDTRIYCEASSGFYKNGQPALSKKALETIRQQGFDMNADTGNYSLDMPLHGDAGLKRAASLMLKTLYLGYAADIGEVTAYAPLIAAQARCNADSQLADNFWRRCEGEAAPAGTGHP